MSGIPGTIRDVASKRSDKYPHQWADGTWHSKPQNSERANEAWGAIAQYQDAQRNGTATPTLEAATRLLISGQQPTEGPPPQGTYDPVLDYNAGAAGRGLTQTQNDAQTLFEQGQEDYGLGLGDLTRDRDYTLGDLLTGRDRNLTDLTTGRDRGLADLGTGETRLNQDYGLQTSELGRQFGILGRQQAEGAAQRGVTSAGLLGKSAAVRGANQQREQGQLDLGHNRGLEDIGTSRTRLGQDYTTGTGRVNEDYTTGVGRTNSAFDRGKLGLDLGNARQFGGFNGAMINNPLTNRPYTGSLATGVQRAFTENEAYQGGILGQKIGQAQAGGYVSPLLATLQDMRRKIGSR